MVMGYASEYLFTRFKSGCFFLFLFYQIEKNGNQYNYLSINISYIFILCILINIYKFVFSKLLQINMLILHSLLSVLHYIFHHWMWKMGSVLTVWANIFSHI